MVRHQFLCCSEEDTCYFTTRAGTRRSSLIYIACHIVSVMGTLQHTLVPSPLASKRSAGLIVCAEGNLPIFFTCSIPEKNACVLYAYENVPNSSRIYKRKYLAKSTLLLLSKLKYMNTGFVVKKIWTEACWSSEAWRKSEEPNRKCPGWLGGWGGEMNNGRPDLACGHTPSSSLQICEEPHRYIAFCTALTFLIWTLNLFESEGSQEAPLSNTVHSL